MKKISLIGTAPERDALFERLVWLGCVELTDRTELLTQEDWQPLVRPQAAGLDVLQLERELMDTGNAIEGLSGFSPVKKKGLFPFMPVAAKADLQRSGREKDDLLPVVTRVNELLQKREQLNGEKNRLTTVAATLSPWTALDAPLSLEHTRQAGFACLTAPKDADVSGCTEKLLSVTPGVEISVIGQDEQQRYLYMIYLREYEDELLRELKLSGISRVTFKDMEGNAAQEVSRIRRRLEAIGREHEEAGDELCRLTERLPELKLLHDGLEAGLAAQKAQKALLSTESTFLLWGYLPERAQPAVESALKDFCCAFEIAEPAEEDDPPVLLHNNAVVKPYEMITEMYSLPVYRGLDPNAIMAPFYWLFFGMMLSDAGYGLLLILLCGFALWKLKLRGGTRKLVGLLFQCGFSTLIVGAIYGSWFGDVIPVYSEMVTGKAIEVMTLFNPMKEPMTLLVVCMILGLIHIMVGLSVKAYDLIRHGQVWDAVCDVGFWMLLLLGLPMLALGGTAGAVGKWMAIAGAAGLILFSARSQKNPILRVLLGVGSLYGITGYLSDVLSYSRILALGLATAVIGSVVNTMGTITGPLIFIPIFLGGHAFNLGINALGSYVHASRLQYVEFFGKFYESGGRPFEPVSIHPKYIDVE